MRVPMVAGCLVVTMVLLGAKARAQEEPSAPLPVVPAPVEATDASPKASVRIHVRTQRGQPTARVYLGAQPICFTAFPTERRPVLEPGKARHPFRRAAPAWAVCDAEVPGGTQLTIRLGANAPRTLSVPSDASGVDVEVHQVKAEEPAGPALVALGGVALGVGLVSLFVAGIAEDSYFFDDGTAKTASTVAAVTLVTGALALVGGIALLVNRPTDVHVVVEPTRSPQQGYDRKDALLGDVPSARLRDMAAPSRAPFTPLGWVFTF